MGERDRLVIVVRFGKRHREERLRGSIMAGEVKICWCRRVPSIRDSDVQKRILSMHTRCETEYNLVSDGWSNKKRLSMIESQCLVFVEMNA